jgi:hypothetical protein
MGEVVGDQTANQAGKPLKKAEKKITHSGTVGLRAYLFLVLYCPIQSVSVS